MPWPATSRLKSRPTSRYSPNPNPNPSPNLNPKPKPNPDPNPNPNPNSTPNPNPKTNPNQVDIYKTVCDALGIGLPVGDTHPVEGSSLLPLLRARGTAAPPGWTKVSKYIGK